MFRKGFYAALITASMMFSLAHAGQASDSTSYVPPTGTMEAQGGSGGRVIGGPKAMYDEGTAQGGIEIRWPYLYRNGARFCEIKNMFGLGAGQGMGCKIGSCGYAGTGNLSQMYVLNAEGVFFKNCDGKTIYPWTS